MRTFCAGLVTILVVPLASAQERFERKAELGVSGAWQSYSQSTVSPSSSLLFLSGRVGIFVVAGLEIEPEFTTLISGRSNSLYAINANLCYNFETPGRVVPFVLAGYGFANTIPVVNLPTFETQNTVNILNLGAGMKFHFTSRVALRLEYRFQSYSGHEPFYLSSGFGTNDLSVQEQTIQVGISVFF